MFIGNVSQKDKVIGIIGGMGPEATADLFLKIVHNTKAHKDQEHLRVLIDSNAKLPDRVNAIFNEGQSPGPEMAQMAKDLERCGAEIIAIACNTAHYFFDFIERAVDVPVLHMPKLAVGRILSEHPHAKTIGLLATTATVKIGLYQQVAEEFGLKVISPEEDGQQRVQDSIYLIKAGQKEEAQIAVKEVASTLIRDGADILLTGCTELPLVLPQGSMEVPVIDPTLILAQALVAAAQRM